MIYNGENMKTLFVFNHPAPYKVHVFNKLAELTDIQVIFERTKAKDRPDSFYEGNQYKFPAIFLKKGSFANENTYTRELKQYLKEHHGEYDLIIMNGYSTIAEMRAIRYLIKHRIPYVLQINGGIIKKDNPIKGKLKKYFISHANKYFSPCSEADKYLLHYGAREDKIFHYPYGNYFDEEIIKSPLSKEEKVAIRNKWDLPEGTLFVNASQFIERKNNMELINIFKDRKESLLLIGSGDEKDTYISYIKEHEIKNIKILDFQKKNELFEILKSCDYFITLSREDIFGHTTLEAMANGLPVISSNRVISSLDIIKNGENGFLVDINNKEEIINAINKVNPDMSKSAIETAKKNTIEKSAETLFSLLEGSK